MKLSSPTHVTWVLRPHASLPLLAVTSLAALTITGSSRYAATTYAAPARAASGQPTLTFNVSAKLAAAGSGDEGQPINSKVWTKGSKARIETNFGGRPMVFLISPSYIYKLIPSAKAGVRWKNSQGAKVGGGSFDLQALLRNPAQIRSLLKSKGAKFESSSKLGSTPVDIFVVPLAGSNAGGSKSRAYSAKGWLRKSDSLPLRLDINNNSFSAIISWRDYKRGTAVADSLFAAPAGYKIREAEGNPSLLGF